MRVMDIKKKILTVTALPTALACMILTGCNGAARSYVQPLNYEESTAAVSNPDQGFYRPMYVKATESGMSYNKNIVNAATQIYHLRIDISAFSGAVNGDGDKLLTQAALDGFEDILSYLRSRDKNAIVRFAYDPSYGGGKDKEPNLQTMLQHIGQVCPIIERYGNTVTAVEAGLIGPWGEMHSSAVATAEYITPIIDAYLTNTESVPVLVRTPKMIYDHLGITIGDIDGYSIAETERAYRVGLYNDGYLGSANDLGTYTDREREVEFLSAQTAHLPYGGEVVIPSSNFHDIEVCLPEMNKLDLSYLNIEWNNQVIDKWKNSTYTAECGDDEKYYGATAFTYIDNHLGYRFVLTNSVFEYSDNADALRIGLTLENVGFGNLNRTKRAKIILADGDGTAVYSQDVAEFAGGRNYDCSFDFDVQSGTYDVYLCVYGEEYEGVPMYCVQFANDGLWNAQLKANKIGRMEAAA